jgi:hypothetical protein
MVQSVIANGRRSRAEELDGLVKILQTHLSPKHTEACT